MVYLRWNLFRGGQDSAGIRAAASRREEVRAKHAARLAELTEATSAAWTDLQSLRQQKAAAHDAVDFSKKTLDAYLEQFTVSRRSLLDVLLAGNDHYQSAVQWVAVNLNETRTAYQILALTGTFPVHEH